MGKDCFPSLQGGKHETRKKKEALGKTKTNTKRRSRLSATKSKVPLFHFVKLCRCLLSLRSWLFLLLVCILARSLLCSGCL